MNKKTKHGKIMLVLSIPIVIIIAMLVVRGLEETQNGFHYDFEDDKTGSYPKGFVGIWRDTEYTRVVYWDEIHGNVVEVRYLEEPPLNPIIGGGMEFNTLFGLITAGIIEFDIYALSAQRINIDICQTDAEYDFRDDIVIRMPLSSTNDYIAIRNGEGKYERVESFSIKIWYHFRIQFDIETGWRLWINNKLIKFNEYTFEEQPPYFCQLYFATYELGQVFYVDNVKIRILEGY